MIKDPLLILELLANWVEPHQCVKAIYLFGSVARGEATDTSDLDVMLEYEPELTERTELVRSFTEFQASIEAFAKELRKIVPYPLAVHRTHPSDPEDMAWRPVQAAARSPLAIRRKAILVRVPPHPKG